MILSRSQSMALAHVRAYAEGLKADAEAAVAEILQMSDIAPAVFDEAVARLKAHARIALHFHPDRLLPHTTTTVAEALLEQGTYKSQFETALSSGSLTAYPGGQRDLWENRMFGGAYQLEGSTDGQRPKYGALDVMLHPDGPAPRFGSCYFLLSPRVSRRSTFTYLDSHQDPKEKGTRDEFTGVLAALMKDAFFSDFAVGEKDATPRKLVDRWLAHLGGPFADPAAKTPSRNLNHYIEAQVHGDLSLRDDAELLVADPSFKDTVTGRTLEAIGRKYAIGLHWHMGFAMRAEAVPPDFRGPTMPSLARRIAREGRIDASVIGAAAAELQTNPGAWSRETLQELKLLWHVLVRYGEPYSQ